MPRIASTSGRGLTRIGLKRITTILQGPTPFVFEAIANSTNGFTASFKISSPETNITVNWGDGSSVDTYVGEVAWPTHTYQTAGTYTATVSGNLPAFGDPNGFGIIGGLTPNIITRVISWNETTTSFVGACESWQILTQVPALPPNVTNISGMFFDATAFNQDISSWDVSSVTNMFYMFVGATSFNQPIGSWDVSNVTNMGAMFIDATSFNQDLSNWCVSNIPTAPNSFDLGATSWALPRPAWGTCPIYPTISPSTEAFKFNMDTGTLPNIPDLSSNTWTPPAANRGTTNISLVDGGPYTTGRYLFNNNAGNNAGISTLAGFQGGTPPAYAVHHNNNIASGSWTMECNVFMVANTGIINRMTIWESATSRVAIQRPAGVSSNWVLAVTFSSSTATNSGQGVNLVLPDFVADAWVHLVVTCELTGALGTYNVRCHVNGEPQGSVNFSVANFALYANPTQGAYVGTQSPFANGSVFYIDNVRLLSGTPFPVTRFIVPTTAFNQ